MRILKNSSTYFPLEEQVRDTRVALAICTTTPQTDQYRRFRVTAYFTPQIMKHLTVNLMTTSLFKVASYGIDNNCLIRQMACPMLWYFQLHYSRSVRLTFQHFDQFEQNLIGRRSVPFHITEETPRGMAGYTSIFHDNVLLF